MQDLAQERFDKLEWMLDEAGLVSENERDEYTPPYGDVTELNSCRLIMDSVGKETLKEIGQQSINLLETSVAIYEANGDYAFGMFSSGWCKIMDAASRALCQTDDNREALSCGKWLCHENCWNNSAKRAIETGRSTEIECVGGIHLYAEPIYAGARVVGAINIGHGDPPKSSDKLKALADAFDVDPAKLKQIGDSYKSRPKFIVDIAKKLLQSFAKLIGEIVEKAEAQRKQQEIQEREAHLNNVLRAIRNVNQLIVKENDTSRLIQKACEELSDTMGYFNAWIALLNEESRNVTLSGSAGFNGGFKAMRKILNQGCFPSCMRRTLETSELVVIDDPATKCADCPLASQYEGRSALTHRLENFGILSVSVPAHFAHDEDEQDLFVEVATDLAFALSKIETQKEIRIKNHIIQTTPQPMSLVSSDYHYLAVNEAYSRLYGETSDKITGRRITDFIDPEVFEQEIKAHLDRCLEGETFQYEILVDFPETGPRWMRMEYTPYRDKDNRIAGVVSHGMDITERKRAEDELRVARELSERIIEDGPVAITLVDRNGKIVLANHHAERLLGLKKPDLAALSYNSPEWTITDVDGAPFADEFLPFHQIMSTGQAVYDVQHAITRPDGVRKILSINGAPLHDGQGRIDRAVFSIEDITDRKRAEMKLVESEALLEATGSIARVGGWQLDVETMAVTWTKETYHIHEVPLNYKPPLDMAIEFFHPDDRDVLSQALQRAIDRGEPYDMELRFITAKGNNLWTRTTCQPEVVGGKTVRLRGTFQDITKRKQAEAEREKLQGQLAQAQKMESIGTLAGGIAHDFNNALTPIMVQTELAKLTIPADNPVQEGLDEIMKAGHRAKDLVKQILTYSRQSQQQRVSMDLTPMVKESLKLLRSSIPTTIEIRQDIETDPCTVLADPTQMQQIVMNLCTNASQAMQEMGSVLEVSLKPVELDEDEAKSYPNIRAGSYVMLTVSDTGIGIEPELMEKIFDPFFTTKPVNEGTGMGLSVVHGIVLNHEGDITVRSELGKGSTFTVLLPRLEQETERESEIIDGSLPTGNERVMFVDDEDPMVKAGEQMLTQLGYQVEVKTSALEALAAFREQSDRYDLVMTDMSMPNMTGDNLAKAMMRVRPDIPVIICTGFSHQIDEEKALAMGIRAFVMKPFVVKEIAETIRKVLDSDNNNG